jgi:deazaflavin-dependent oxidoreductase (nitroreductase family)
VNVPAEQKSDVRFTPPRRFIPWITRVTVWVYEKTNGRLGGRSAGMQNLLLRTVGRRSGRVSTVCLPYWVDPEGHRIVVASYAGSPRHPAWYHNLKDREANPEVVVRDGAVVLRADAQVLGGEERAGIWYRLIADRPFYARYQEKTERRIPIVRLIEKSQ